MLIYYIQWSYHTLLLNWQSCWISSFRISFSFHQPKFCFRARFCGLFWEPISGGFRRLELWGWKLTTAQQLVCAWPHTAHQRPHISACPDPLPVPTHTHTQFLLSGMFKEKPHQKSDKIATKNITVMTMWRNETWLLDSINHLHGPVVWQMNI